MVMALGTDNGVVEVVELLAPLSGTVSRGTMAAETASVYRSAAESESSFCDGVGEYAGLACGIGDVVNFGVVGDEVVGDGFGDVGGGGVRDCAGDVGDAVVGGDVGSVGAVGSLCEDRAVCTSLGDGIVGVG